jgi:hypothetical protein
MKLRFLLLVIPLLIRLEACKPKKETTNHVPDIKLNTAQLEQPPQDVVYYLAANSIYGEWFNINPDSSTTLIFNLDSTFKYINKINPTDSVNGKWSVKDSDYVLRSSPSHNNNGETLGPKEISFQFEKRFRFKDGFIYEVNKEGSLSTDYFVQSKNYR